MRDIAVGRRRLGLRFGFEKVTRTCLCQCLATGSRTEMPVQP
jgi:hypothetical protein